MGQGQGGGAPKDNTNSIHSMTQGAERAVKAIIQGTPFSEFAQRVYDQVIEDLGVDLDRLSGIDRVRLQRAARFETAARLFDVAAMCAAQAGDVDRWERYNQRGGWIGGKSFLALGDIKAALADNRAFDYEVLIAEGGDHE